MVKMRGADALVRALRLEGVKYVFGVVGTALLPILDALYDEHEIRFIGTRHEAAASFMAGTYGFLTGDPGVCMSIGGPGATGLMSPSLPTRDLPMPMIMISTAPSTMIAGTSNIFDDVAVHEIYAHTTKWSVLIDRPERVQALMRKAFIMAGTGKTGRVFVAITGDAQSEIVETPDYSPSNYRQMKRVLLQPEPQMIERAACLLAEAKRPVILVGGEAIGATKELVGLAERYQIPVLGDAVVKGIFPENHPLYVGMIGYGFTKASQELFEEADVVLNAGSALDDLAVFVDVAKGWVPGTWPRDCKIIQISRDPAVVGRWFPVNIPLIANVSTALAQIQAAMDKQPSKPLYDSVRMANYKHRLEEWMTSVKGELTSNTVPIHPARAAADVLRAASDAYFVIDGCIQPMYAIPLARVDEWRRWQPLIAGGLGCGVPSAIATKLVMPDKRVVGLVGDAAFSIHVQELATAVEYGIPVTWCIFNDNQWGWVKHRQVEHYPGRSIGMIFEKNPDYAAVAKGFHCHGQRVVNPDQIIPAVEEALRANEKGIPAVVDIQIDPEPIQWSMKIAMDLKARA